jgi:hypothetical protein
MKKILGCTIISLGLMFSNIAMASIITVTSGQVSEADTNNDNTVDAFTFNFLGLSAFDSAEDAIDVVLSFVGLDLDASSEFLVTGVTTAAGTFNLGQWTGVSIGSGNPVAFNSSGTSTFSIFLSSIGSFSGGDLSLVLTPSSAVNPYLEGTTTRCGGTLGNCDGYMSASLSYTAAQVPAPSSLVLILVGFAALLFRNGKKA